MVLISYIVLFFIFLNKMCFSLTKKENGSVSLNKTNIDIAANIETSEILVPITSTDRNEKIPKILKSIDNKITVTNNPVPSAISDIISVCIENTCILKCCPENQFNIIFKYCGKAEVSYSNVDWESLPIYDRHLRHTSKKLKDVYTIKAGIFSNRNFSRHVEDRGNIFNHNHYLTEDGILYEEIPNKWDRWVKLNTSQFCVEYSLQADEKKEPEIRFWTWNPVKEETEKIEVSSSREVFITSGFLISIVFLSLVLLTYGLLQELRNIGGLILMAYVTSLVAAFLLQATMRLQAERSPTFCLISTFLAYFFWMASFCWTNVMSCDIWWTFRGFAKSRLIHRRGELFKFGVYCAYAWGVPLSMTAVLTFLELVDLRPYPWIVAPGLWESSGCFITGPPKVLYLYVPMLILASSNWAFFLMTVVNMARLRRGTTVLDSAAGDFASHRTQRQRLMVYLRLSIIMGVNWALEVLSYFRPEDSLSYFGDAFNVLLGLSIFIIFVCKRQILAKLIKRYHGCMQSRRVHYKTRFSDTTESDAGPDSPLRVCADPNGAKSADARNANVFKF